MKTFLKTLYYLWFDLKIKFKLNQTKVVWRANNKHNHTIPNHYPFPAHLVSVGKSTYGDLNVYWYSDDCRLQIGDYCSIAKDVCFLLGGEHSTKFLSTFPLKRILINKSDSSETFSKGPILVDDDVWIGKGAIILSGVHLAQGTVVAAGSVVCNSTEPYSIIGGCPAKLIRKRFPDNIIAKLNSFDPSSISTDLIKQHPFIVEKPLTEYTVQEWDSIVSSC